MGREEGVELVLVAGRYGLLELHEQLGCLYKEQGRRDGDDIGARAVAEIN
jgi:hypothetical protein